MAWLLLLAAWSLLAVSTEPVSGTWERNRAWKQQFCLTQCDGGSARLCPIPGVLSDDLAVWYMTASLDSADWAELANQYQKWLCDVLHGRPAYWAEDRRDVLKCGPDELCLFHALVKSLRNVELTMADQTVASFVVNITAGGPEVLQELDVETTDVLADSGAKRRAETPMQSPLWLQPHPIPGRVGYGGLGWPHKLFRSSASAVVNGREGVLSGLRDKLFRSTAGRVVFTPLRKKGERWQSSATAPDYLKADEYEAVQRQSTALFQSIRRAVTFEALLGTRAGLLQEVRALVLGLHSNAPHREAQKRRLAQQKGPGETLQRYAELNVQEVTDSLPREERQGFVVYEALCGNFGMPGFAAANWHMGALAAEAECMRSVVRYGYDAAAAMVTVTKYFPPEGYSPGDRLRLPDLQLRTNFRPSGYISHSPRDGPPTFWLVSTAAVDTPAGGVDLWRHTVQITYEQQLWTIERAKGVDAARVRGLSDEKQFEAVRSSASRILQADVTLQRKTMKPGPFARPRDCRAPWRRNPSVSSSRGASRRLLEKEDASPEAPQGNAQPPKFQLPIFDFNLDDCILRFLQKERRHLHCAFLHGAGSRPPGGVNRVTKGVPTVYFGDIMEATPGCTSHWWLYANTVSNGWDSHELQALACEAALGPDARDRTIRNTVIFAHSMGNLIFTAALKSRKCKIDKGTVNWMAASAPWHSADAAHTLIKICNRQNPVDRTVGWVCENLGFCLGERVSPAYMSLSPGFPGTRDLLYYAKGYVTHVMCGDSPVGIPTLKYTAAMVGVGRLLNVPDPSDGVVALDSCGLVAPFNASWQRSPVANYYVGRMNHVDTTGRNGNWLVSQELQPLEWVLMHHTDGMELWPQEDEQKPEATEDAPPPDKKRVVPGVVRAKNKTAELRGLRVVGPDLMKQRVEVIRGRIAEQRAGPRADRVDQDPWDEDRRTAGGEGHGGQVDNLNGGRGPSQDAGAKGPGLKGLGLKWWSRGDQAAQERRNGADDEGAHLGGESEAMNAGVQDMGNELDEGGRAEDWPQAETLQEGPDGRQQQAARSDGEPEDVQAGDKPAGDG